MPITDAVPGFDAVVDSSHRYFVDSTEADQGVATATGDRTIKDHVDAIGATKKATIYLLHDFDADETDYTLTTSETIPDNITLEFENGAIIDGSGTLTINGPVVAGWHQIIGSSITVTFGAGSINSVCPEWWGAKGDGTTNDATAINAMFAVARSDAIRKIAFKGESIYRVNSGINMTSMRAWGVIVEGNGAIIHGFTTGKMVVDMLDSYGMTVYNLNVFGGATDTPSYGIAHGRGISGQDATQIKFVNVYCTGNYTIAAIYNGGSEIASYDTCNFFNSEVGGYALYLDSRNEAHITSDFITVTIAQDTWNSFNDNLFIHCTFQQMHATGGPAVRIVGATSGFRLENCYAQAQNSAAFELAFNHESLYLDVHCETTALTENVLFESSNGAMHLNDFTLKEYYAFCTDSVIDCDSADVVTITNGNIIIGDSHTDIPIMGTTGVVNFHGEIHLNQATGDGLYELVNFNGLSGSIYQYKTEAINTFPAATNMTLYSLSDAEKYRIGETLNYEPAAIASVAELPLGAGEAFYVTGTTSITSIAAASTKAGRRLVLIFADILTFTDGNNLKLAGDFVTATGSLIELYCMGGTNWYEISRTST